MLSNLVGHPGRCYIAWPPSIQSRQPPKSKPTHDSLYPPYLGYILAGHAPRTFKFGCKAMRPESARGKILGGGCVRRTTKSMASSESLCLIATDGRRDGGLDGRMDDAIELSLKMIPNSTNRLCKQCTNTKLPSAHGSSYPAGVAGVPVRIASILVMFKIGWKLPRPLDC
jgi:hypothetical protein